MRRTTTGLIAVLATAVLTACGGGPTDPGETIPPGDVDLAILQGDSQEVTVTDTLPFDAVVQVEKGGEPLKDQLVDWVVLRDDCGEPFVSTTRTDKEGKTGNRAVAGTRAWTRPDGPDVCRMQVRYALTRGDSVIAEVDTTIAYRVNPGEPTTPYHATLKVERSSIGDTITMPVSRGGEDRHGNPALWRYASADCCVDVLGTDPGAAASRTLAVTGTGEGQVDVVYPARPGWTTHLSVRVTADSLIVEYASHDG